MQTNPSPVPPKGKRLLDQVRDAIRTKHNSYRTEQTYVDWITRFILFQDKRHPAEMGTKTYGTISFYNQVTDFTC